MVKRKLTVKQAEGEASHLYYTVREDGECFSGWMSKQDAEDIATAINAYPELVARLKQAIEALRNAPMVGEVYDEQHSDTQLRAIHEATTLLATLNSPA